MYLNAYQSYFFNEMLARRLDRLDRVLVGDWAMKTENGARFLVEDATKEQPRADRFEIAVPPASVRVVRFVGQREPGEIERAVVAESGATPESSIRPRRPAGFCGERRSLRIPLADLEWTLEGTLLTPFHFHPAPMRPVLRTHED